tara:strand:+ start:123 stop:290 length:168 start_codon:yes stop_codon:yes gene_type:complete
MRMKMTSLTKSIGKFTHAYSISVCIEFKKDAVQRVVKLSARQEQTLLRLIEFAAW